MGKPLIPDYAGPCISNVVPALLEPGDSTPAWLPAEAVEAEQVVLLVLDGLGWEQLQSRRHLAPTLSAMTGGPISSVVPSTTATALTSIATGLPPGQHGVVGYRVAVNGEVLNILRWTTPNGDARHRIDPENFQPNVAFCGHRPPIVTKAEFLSSGFSGAHLSQVRFNGYRMTSTLITEVRRLLRSGEPFIYAYYDGVDKVAHEYGLDEHYDAEVTAADRLVADVIAVAAPGRRRGRHRRPRPGRRGQAHRRAGHARCRPTCRTSRVRVASVGCTPGRAGPTRWWRRPRSCHADVAWVRTLDETVAEGWWGPLPRRHGACPVGRRGPRGPRRHLVHTTPPTPDRFN